jgi:hypothetical protein
MDQNTILSTLAIIVSVLGVVIGIINHKQVKSRCCKREASFSLDITSTTPEINTPTKEDIKKIDQFIKDKINNKKLEIL